MILLAAWLSLATAFSASAAKPAADLLVINAQIVTMNASGQILSNASLAVRDGVIVEIGKDLDSKYKAARKIDAAGGILLPGFVNTHTHVASGYLRGIYGGYDLSRWWFEEVWPLERRILNHDFVYSAAVLGIADQLRSGVTAINDMSLCSASVARAAAQMGIRARIGETLLDEESPCAKNPQASLSAVAELRKTVEGNPRLALAVAPHGAHNLSPKGFTKAVEFARANSLPIHMHLGESEADARLVKKRTGKALASYLRSLKIPKGSVFAHGVKLDAASLKAIKDSGGALSINLSSNRNLAVGEPPLMEALELGVPVTVGSDGAVTNAALDFFEEMRAILGFARVRHRGKSKLEWAGVLAMATSDGARALGLPGHAGTLQAGGAADFILLQPPADRRLGFLSDAEFVVKAGRSADIKYVFAAGKALIEDGKLTRELQDLVRLQAEKLKPELKKLVRGAGS